MPTLLFCNGVNVRNLLSSTSNLISFSKIKILASYAHLRHIHFTVYHIQYLFDTEMTTPSLDNTSLSEATTHILSFNPGFGHPYFHPFPNLPDSRMLIVLIVLELQSAGYQDRDLYTNAKNKNYFI
ncbi:hypothetical protein KP509_24G037300 [Ceratopteris richardii]|uniref:Uncharacterized protein n=1 Tax=Ceratopteris richardii TaxID=49495 RepID=A0A8T2RWG8_CERRI|nr:hypothetical protein KP509_24G037300 [Ceratopteris richardii]